ncbi:MAG: hypothetical protein PHF80_07530 [Methanothrix sp.]|nr:hypothetical protein [Methanothrix sp.]
MGNSEEPNKCLNAEAISCMGVGGDAGRGQKQGRIGLDCPVEQGSVRAQVVSNRHNICVAVS